MTRQIRLCLILALSFFPSGCSHPPPKEGFTDLAIANSRQTLAATAAGPRVAHWDSLRLTMLESSDVVLATLQDITLSLTPSKDAAGNEICLTTLTATLSGNGWCTSTTYNQGLGQVIRVYFEKAGHALTIPWTLGTVKIEASGVSQTLSYSKAFDVKILETAMEAEIVIQPCLWNRCP